MAPPELLLTVARSSDDCPEQFPDERSCFLDSSDIETGQCFADRDNPKPDQFNYAKTAGFSFYDAIQFFWLNNTLSLDRHHSTINFHWDALGKLKEIELSNYKATLLRTQLWYRDDPFDQALGDEFGYNCLLPRKHLVPAKADIMVCIDVTGSMQPYLNEAVGAVTRFVNQLNALGYDIKLGLITFRDELQSPFEAPAVHTFGPDVFTDDYTAYIAELGTLVATGGGDIPETSLDAIWLATTQPWRGVPYKKHIVLITDAPPKIPEVHVTGIDETVGFMQSAGIDHMHLYCRMQDYFDYYHNLQDDPPAPGGFVGIGNANGLTILFESLLFDLEEDPSSCEFVSSEREDTAGVIASVQTLRGTYGKSAVEDSPTTFDSVPIWAEGEGFICPEIDISDIDSTLSHEFSEVTMHFDSTGLLKRVYHGGLLECQPNRLMWDRDFPPLNTCGVTVPMIQYDIGIKPNVFYLWLITFGPLGHYKRACRYAKFCGCFPTGESSESTAPGCPCKDLCLWVPTGCSGQIGSCPSTFDIDAWYAHSNRDPDANCLPSCTGLVFTTYTWSGECGCLTDPLTMLSSCVEGERPPSDTSGYIDDPCFYRGSEAVGGGCT